MSAIYDNLKIIAELEATRDDVTSELNSACESSVSIRDLQSSEWYQDRKSMIRMLDKGIAEWSQK